MTRLSQNITALIERAHLSQTQVAQAVGVRQATISDWKRGTVEPEPANVAKLAALFRVSERELRYEDLSKPVRWGEQDPPKTGEEAGRKVRALASLLEADIHQRGGIESDLEAARLALARDETVVMFTNGTVSAEALPDSFARYLRFVRAFRMALAERIIRRGFAAERAAQVESTPEAPALPLRGQRLSEEELDRAEATEASLVQRATNTASARTQGRRGHPRHRGE